MQTPQQRGGYMDLAVQVISEVGTNYRANIGSLSPALFARQIFADFLPAQNGSYISD